MPSDLPDNSAGQNPELGADFRGEITEAPQVVSGTVGMGRRRFLGALAAGAAALGVSEFAIAGDPVPPKSANGKVQSVAVNKLSPEEAALREWKRKHILKNPDDYNRELDPAFDKARQSQDAEKWFYASELMPEKYVRLHPANFDKSSDWNAEGKVAIESGTHFVIFRVAVKEKGIDPNTNQQKITVPKGAEKWFMVGRNKIASKVNPQSNPDGLNHSIELFSDPNESVKAVEASILKGGSNLAKIANRQQ